jgi:hypothetical protein
MDTLKKLFAIGILAGALGLGTAAVAGAQESSTDTTVQSDDGSSSADSDSATASDDDSSAPADAPDDANCPNMGEEAPAAAS